MGYRVATSDDLNSAKNTMSYITAVINAYGYVSIKMLRDAGIITPCVKEELYPDDYGWTSDRDLEVWSDSATGTHHVEFGKYPRQLYFNSDKITTTDSVEATDMVNHPEHYKHNGIETIDVIDAWLDSMGPGVKIGYYNGNCIKYISRWNDKNGIEDLKKCRWYLDRLIKILENESTK